MTGPPPPTQPMASCCLKGQGNASGASWASDGTGRDPRSLSLTVSWDDSEFSELKTKIDIHLILPQLVCTQPTLDMHDLWDAISQPLSHVILLSTLWLLLPTYPHLMVEKIEIGGKSAIGTNSQVITQIRFYSFLSTPHKANCNETWLYSIVLTHAQPSRCNVETQ